MIKVHNEDFKIEVLGEKNVKSVLERGCSLLGSLSIPYWLAYGTALGLYRDGGYIPSDTDIDVTTVGNHRKDEIIDLFTVNGFRLVRTTTCDDGFVYQTAFLDPDTNIIFDIDYLRGNGELLSTESELSGVFNFPIEFLTKIEYIPYGDIMYPMIRPEEYLQYVYGKDWKTPTPKSKEIYKWGSDGNYTGF